MDDEDRVTACPECGSDEIVLLYDTKGFPTSVNTKYPWPLSIFEKLSKTSATPDGYDKYIQCDDCETKTHIETKVDLKV